jgi:hypothetical protein
MIQKILGILATICALSACNGDPTTSDEAMVYGAFSDAQAGRMVSFSDRLSPDYHVTGFRGGMGAHPPQESLMHAVRDIRHTIGFQTEVAVIPNARGQLSSARADRELGVEAGEVIENATFSQVMLRAYMPFPQRVLHGATRDLALVTIVRGQLSRADGTSRSVELISRISILDPCLLPDERQGRDGC